MKNREIMKLIKKAKSRDPDAFTELMQFYLKDMYHDAIAILMNDEDAADAIQETLLICWEKLGTLKENKYFKTWMIRILINNCYSIRNKKKTFADLENVAELFQNDEYNLEIKEMLSMLDEKYRVPVMMFYIQGYKISEISQILEIPQSTIQTRLARAREKLRDLYEK